MIIPVTTKLIVATMLATVKPSIKSKAYLYQDKTKNQIVEYAREREVYRQKYTNTGVK